MSKRDPTGGNDDLDPPQHSHGRRGCRGSLGVRVADATEFGGSFININHDLFLSNPEVQQVVKRAIDRAD